MKRPLIVCALDRSNAAHAALGRAVSSARWHDADLHVLHVLSPRAVPPFGASDDGRIPELAVDEDARTWMAGLLREHAADSGAVQSLFYCGDPADAIVAHVRAHQADLVVLGRRSYPMLRRYRGSVARSVARAAVCPVLIEPGSEEGTRAPHFNEIVCAVDFSPASAAALRCAVTLAQESGGRLHTIHVLTGLPDEFRLSGSRAQRYLPAYNALRTGAHARLRAGIPADALDWCAVQEQVIGGIPHREIVQVADRVRADLIVVGVRPRTRMVDSVVGATLPALLRRARCAVLTVPAAADEAEWPEPVGVTADIAEQGMRDLSASI